MAYAASAASTAGAAASAAQPSKPPPPPPPIKASGATAANHASAGSPFPPSFPKPPSPPGRPGADDIDDPTTISAKALLEQSPAGEASPASAIKKTGSPPSAKSVLPARSAAAGPVDIDWDDEDEKTTVFDRGSEDASHALLHSAPPLPAAGAPPPTVPPPAYPRAGAHATGGMLARSHGSVPPPTLPRRASPPLPTMPAGARLATAALPDYPMPARRGRGLMFAIVALAVIGAALAALMLMPKTGSLLVTVAGPNNRAIDSLSVLLDDQQVCASSPCRVDQLAAGTHLLLVTAAGYQGTAAKAVKINAGDEEVVNVTLAVASEGTGFRIMTEGTGLVLNVDGKEVGPLPQELKDLEPGLHKIKIHGSERYAVYEDTVRVEPDKMLEIEPELKVLKGLATIKPGENAEDARILLVSGHERRPVTKVPIKVDISTDKPYRLVASKPGYETFEEPITFEDGKAEKTFVIDLVEKAADAPAEPPAVAAAPRPRVPAPKAPRAAAPSKPAPKKPAPSTSEGQGKVTLTSDPPSNVILDGRPLGSTPKVGYPVSAGTHMVVFVHPEYGRKATPVTVPAGKVANISVKFP